jgi:hypothetical protein
MQAEHSRPGGLAILALASGCPDPENTFFGAPDRTKLAIRRTFSALASAATTWEENPLEKTRGMDLSSSAIDDLRRLLDEVRETVGKIASYPLIDIATAYDKQKTSYNLYAGMSYVFLVRVSEDIKDKDNFHKNILLEADCGYSDFSDSINAALPHSLPSPQYAAAFAHAISAVFMKARTV